MNDPDLKVQKLREMGAGHLLTPSEAGGLYRVDPKTVTRWAKAGRIPAVKTRGGHRRYRSEDILDDLAPGWRDEQK